MMSTRERWMVYPLLLLSVALALKANLSTVSDSEIADRVICHELVVTSPDGKTLVQIGSMPMNRATIRILTPTGQEAVLIGVDEDATTGQIETRRGGRSQTQLGGDLEGGRLLLTASVPDDVDPGTAAETRLKVGHDADLRITGLMMVDSDGVPLAEEGDSPSPWGFWSPWDLRWQATAAMTSRDAEEEVQDETAVKDEGVEETEAADQ